MRVRPGPLECLMQAVAMAQPPPGVASSRQSITRHALPPRAAWEPLNPNAARESIMSPNDHEIFWRLERHARSGAPLSRCAREVASIIRDDLAAVGLSKAAIRRVACALLSLSAGATRRPDTDPSPPRPTRGEEQ